MSELALAEAEPAYEAVSSEPLRCPKCGKPFFDTRHDGYVETACGTCSTAYAVTTGTLSKPSSTRIVHQRQGTKQMGIYSHFHQFSVFIPGGYKSFQYSTRTAVGGIVFSKDTRASVVCTRLGRELQDIVFVYSHITHHWTNVAGVGAKARRTACTAALLVFLGGAVAAGVLGTSFVSSLLLGLVAGGIAGGLVYRAKYPRVRLSAREAAVADARRRLLETRIEVVSKLRALMEWQGKIRERVDRLHAQEVKMSRVDPRLYHERIEKCREAQQRLREALGREEPLIAACGRVAAMTALELEAEHLDETVGTAPFAEVFTRAEELRRLEASIASVRVDVDAAD